MRSIIRDFSNDATATSSYFVNIVEEIVRNFCRCFFTFSIKRKMRHFYVLVVQKRQRNVRKSVMHVHIVGLLIKLIVFWRSRRRVVGCILLIGSFSENVTFKINSRFFNLCRIFENVKCRRIFLMELISWGLHSSLGREQKSSSWPVYFLHKTWS